ncbi:thioredoxin family protein [Pseudolabrys sp. FHR47]|uniref:thioredoxin family protein n=1 Tax=Pseudolabrys sp. FHR47 TaxID=2562284 RepID=UPI0010BE7A17|nr:thioredoxin family protein [Pseudolabrys sp. FHR47]
MTISRRHLLLATAAISALAVVPARAAEPILTDDGLYKQPWFLESFLELADDLDEAQKTGKRFVVMWELKGCPYCKETHFVNFAREDISSYIKGNFVVLQLNIIGSRKVKDFDGQELSEKELAAKYGIRFTPTFQFFDENALALKDREPQKREVARAPGYLRPDDFLAMFRFVREKAYRDKSFRDYVKSQRS